VEARLDLLTGPHDVPRARAFVRRTLSDWGIGEVVDEAEWLTSELLANAVLHARPPYRLVVHQLAVAIRIEVWDSAPDILPLRRTHSSEATTGRGLAVADALSESWGVETSLDGTQKGVWVELALSETTAQVPSQREGDASQAAPA
jgi:anti-sigma regulatory factor (Ser/Thr protein kinase)